MGLDMYLNKRVFVGANYQPRKVTGTVELRSNDIPISINFDKIVCIEEETGYWRKANAIHNWFVENVQGGVDDCEKYYVSTDNLKSLLDTVNTVLDSIKSESSPETAKSLLPTTEGFFFGSKSYDEWYFQDLEYTKEILESALKDENGEYYYQSSW